MIVHYNMGLSIDFHLVSVKIGYILGYPTYFLIASRDELSNQMKNMKWEKPKLIVQEGIQGERGHKVGLRITTISIKNP